MVAYSYTVEQARDLLYATFFEAWKDPETGFPSVVPNVDPSKVITWDGIEPGADAPISQVEVYVFVRHGDGRQASLRGEKGRRWRRTGVMLIRIYVPKNGTLKTADRLSNVALKAFEGKRGVGEGKGITFPRVKPSEQGTLKDRYLTDVLVSFEYDELI